MRTLTAIACCLLMSVSAPTLVHAGPAKRIPDDATIILHVKVTEFVQSELYKTLHEKLGKLMEPKDPQYLEFKKATGFDPEKDLESVTFGAAGNFSSDDPIVYVVAKGKFSQSKLEAYARQKVDQVKVGKLAGLTTYTPVSDSTEKGPMAVFGLFDETTMLAASRSESFEKLVEVVKRGGSGSIGSSSSPLAQVISRHAENHLSGAMLFPEEAKQKLQANPQIAPLASLQTVSVNGEATSDLSFNIEAAADTPENGKSVYITLNGLLAMGKMMLAQNPEVAQTLDKLELIQDGAVNKVSFSITNEEVTKAMGQMIALQRMKEAQRAAAGGDPFRFPGRQPPLPSQPPKKKDEAEKAEDAEVSGEAKKVGEGGRDR